MGLQGEANAICTMQVNFPKTGLHEDIADEAAVFLMLQANDHPNMKQMQQLDKALHGAEVASQLISLDGGDLSDSAAETIANMMHTFFKRWL
ncbi:MAG: hypothetical protein Q9P01_19960 [Anaerolineae bacterium]|nr:hypothetical protein [Anaerolineae bacterium]MDQ7037025.1 hypothetical protein [Anaerolineae bacterium]